MVIGTCLQATCSSHQHCMRLEGFTFLQLSGVLLRISPLHEDRILQRGRSYHNSPPVHLVVGRCFSCAHAFPEDCQNICTRKVGMLVLRRTVVTLD